MRRRATDLLAVAIAAAFLVLLVWSAVVDVPPLCPRGPHDIQPCDSPRD